MAEAGDEFAVERLLSRPTLPPEAAPYWSAFVYLSRDRPTESLNLGMAGGLSLPRPVPREAIRREGVRLGHTGEGLDDFTEIVASIDDIYVEVTVKAEAARARAAAEQSRAKKR